VQKKSPGHCPGLFCLLLYKHINPGFYRCNKRNQNKNMLPCVSFLNPMAQM